MVEKEITKRTLIIIGGILVMYITITSIIPTVLPLLTKPIFDSSKDQDIANLFCSYSLVILANYIYARIIAKNYNDRWWLKTELRYYLWIIFSFDIFMTYLRSIIYDFNTVYFLDYSIYDGSTLKLLYFLLLLSFAFILYNTITSIPCENFNSYLEYRAVSIAQASKCDGKAYELILKEKVDMLEGDYAKPYGWSAQLVNEVIALAYFTYKTGTSVHYYTFEVNLRNNETKILYPDSDLYTMYKNNGYSPKY